MRELFPEGISRLDDLPHTLFGLINRTLLTLSWEELPEDERPPKRIWTDNEKLNSWFEDVRRKREAEMKGDSWNKAIDDPVDNDLTAGLRG